MSVHGGTIQWDGRVPDDQIWSKLYTSASRHAPDNSDTYKGSEIGGFYRAFHTTAESRLERQPYVSISGNVYFWSGRLDNRDELVAVLSNSLSSDRTDVAIVAAAFDRWGTGCLARLLGDWAVAIWNPNARTLDLAVDYIGIRHIFYFHNRLQLVWCTHLDLLVRSLPAPPRLNDEYIAGYLASFPEAHLTPYQEIQAVPPSGFVHVKGADRSIGTYWDLTVSKPIRYKTDTEYEEHFRSLFRQSVGRRLRSDSPVLAELSGGLDSSSIVCVADDLIISGDAGTPRVDTITYYPENDSRGDERIFVAKIEEKRGRIGSHIGLKSDQFFCLDDSGEFVGAPSSLVRRSASMRLLSELTTQQGNRVLLSGVGGDEFLGGVPNPRPLLADLIVQLRAFELGRQLMSWSVAKRSSSIQLLLQSALLLMPSRVQVAFSRDAGIAPWVGSQLVHKHDYLRKQAGLLNGYRRYSPTFRDGMQTVLALTRRMGFVQPAPSCQIEMTYPYLDRSLVEFLVLIPATQLLRPGERRSLMRRALAGVLPPEILNRKSKGTADRSQLVALQEQWIALEDLFRAAISAERGYINPRAFHDALRDAKHGVCSHPVRLFRAISLEVWLRNLQRCGLLGTRSTQLVSSVQLSSNSTI